MNCPRCQSNGKVKNGFVKGIQRFRCKECQYNYSVTKRKGEYSEAVRKKPCIYIWKDWAFVPSVDIYM